ncbi:hypothetical protein L9F63_004785, partial [Diploptera punctata]
FRQFCGTIKSHTKILISDFRIHWRHFVNDLLLYVIEVMVNGKKFIRRAAIRARFLACGDGQKSGTTWSHVLELSASYKIVHKHPKIKLLYSFVEFNTVYFCSEIYRLYLEILCTSCERSLNYATKMARMLQSSTWTCVACMGMIVWTVAMSPDVEGILKLFKLLSQETFDSKKISTNNIKSVFDFVPRSVRHIHCATLMENIIPIFSYFHGYQFFIMLDKTRNLASFAQREFFLSPRQTPRAYANKCEVVTLWNILNIIEKYVQIILLVQCTFDLKFLGMYTLSVITEVSPDQFLPHSSSMAFLFSNMLNSLQDCSSPLAYYTVITMIHFVPLAEGDQGLVNVYHQLMPRVMQIVRALCVTDEEKAIEAMELFEDLVETAVTVIVPHIKPLVEMCLEFASNKNLGEGIRVKALSFISWLTRTKKKAIVKHKLVEPIIEVLFQLMSTPPENEEKEEYFCADIDENTPMTCATQTLDVLALHLPPDKLLPPLLFLVQKGLNGTDLYAKKASHLALAVIVEGCAESIRTKYLESFLQCICKDITNPAGVVRNAALFALGQFSEHLQPDISQYAPHLLPVLFDYLERLCNQIQEKGKEPPGLDRMFYALEMFCENLGEELLPYLPTLMERLFTALNPNNSVHLRELGMSCIGAT